MGFRRVLFRFLVVNAISLAAIYFRSVLQTETLLASSQPRSRLLHVARSPKGKHRGLGRRRAQCRAALRKTRRARPDWCLFQGQDRKRSLVADGAVAAFLVRLLRETVMRPPQPTSAVHHGLKGSP